MRYRAEIDKVQNSFRTGHISYFNGFSVLDVVRSNIYIFINIPYMLLCLSSFIS